MVPTPSTLLPRSSRRTPGENETSPAFPPSVSPVPSVVIRENPLVARRFPIAAENRRPRPANPPPSRASLLHHRGHRGHRGVGEETVRGSLFSLFPFPEALRGIHPVDPASSIEPETARQTQNPVSFPPSVSPVPSVVIRENPVVACRFPIANPPPSLAFLLHHRGHRGHGGEGRGDRPQFAFLLVSLSRGPPRCPLDGPGVVCPNPRAPCKHETGFFPVPLYPRSPLW